MNLNTAYLGLALRNPLIVSSCPLSQDLEGIQAIEAAGAGAVVLFSLFEEQIQYDQAFIDYFMEQGTESFPEAITYFPPQQGEEGYARSYLDLIRRASQSVKIPVIASLNAASPLGWMDYAAKIEAAGASALELNIYLLPLKIRETSDEIERQYLDIVRMVRETIRIPLAVKLHPFFSGLGSLAKKLEKIGVDGLVLFNRFYEPDFDIEELEAESTLQLSNSYELRLPLRWIALLSDQLDLSLASSTGLHTSTDMVKAIMAGADATMCASCLLQRGLPYVSELLQGLQNFMERKGYESITQMKGVMSYQKLPNPQIFERANYIKALKTFKSQRV